MSTEMQQNRSGKSVVKEELVPLSMKEMLAIYIHLRQTLIGQPAITSVAAGVAVCCRICSTTVNRLISDAKQSFVRRYLRAGGGSQFWFWCQDLCGLTGCGKSGNGWMGIAVDIFAVAFTSCTIAAGLLSSKVTSTNSVVLVRPNYCGWPPH